jgi:hypothetical protein
MPSIFAGEIIYDVDSLICRLPLRLSFSVVFVIFCGYIIPVSLITFVYLKLVRYVKVISKRVTPVNILSRAQRELKMVRRIILLLSTLSIVGIPYITSLLMSFFTTSPKYHFRIILISSYISLTFIMIVLFQITEPFKEFVMKRISYRPNIIIPAVT